ncbi:MAG: hypothetical protein Q9214_000878 [Letrouitia sp. 1 TL-2023]
MHGSRDKALPLNDLNLYLKDETIPLSRFASLLKDIVHQERHSAAYDTRETPPRQTIQFPYARHSSYSELCHLVSTFKPSDIYPCTFDENSGWERSIESLFGHLCSGTVFCYDEQMQARRRADAATPLETKAEPKHLEFTSPRRETESADHHPDGTRPAVTVSDPSSTVHQAPLPNRARSERSNRVAARGNLDVARSFSAWTKDDDSTRPPKTTKKRTRSEDRED